MGHPFRFAFGFDTGSAADSASNAAAVGASGVPRGIGAFRPRDAVRDRSGRGGRRRPVTDRNAMHSVISVEVSSAAKCRGEGTPNVAHASQRARRQRSRRSFPRRP